MPQPTKTYIANARILDDLKLRFARAITNDSVKIRTLENEGIRVNSKVEGSSNPENSRYLSIKAELMNGLLLLKHVTALTTENDSHESQSAD